MDIFTILLYVGLAVITVGSVALAVVALRWKPKYCPSCTLVVPAEAKVCPHCHKDL